MLSFSKILRSLAPVALLAGLHLVADQPLCGDDVARDAKSFDQQIAPLLASRCLDCHNGNDKKGGLDLTRVETAMQGGDSGAVIVRGKSADSVLWQRVRDGDMPPKKPLPAAEMELLKRWIDAGAVWGRSPIDPYAVTTSSRAGYDFWSLQPVRRVEPPPSDAILAAAMQGGIQFPAQWLNPQRAAASASTVVDRFVGKKLVDEGLAPSPLADRRTLIRRLSFDLIGLPPTPQEVAAFEADSSENAYEKLVDRLLDSPHFGERWARHWLDIIRFGESQGFERDKLRNNSWRYRDWVVRAFNQDLPYDEFARLQLAGDVLRPGDPDGMIATGFLVAGAYDEVGQVQQSAAMRAVVRQDEFEDLISTVGETFLGLTVHCGRCHDHKFDPVPQRDYYRLQAALAGIRHGERELPSRDGKPDRSEHELLTRFQREMQELEQRLEQLDGDVRRTILAERRERFEKQPKREPPRPMAAWEFNNDWQASVGELHVTAHNGAKLDDGGLRLSGAPAFAASTPLKANLKAKTLEAWVRLDDLSQQGGGVMSVQTLDGATFDAIVFGEKEPACWMAGSNGFVRTQSFHGPAEDEAKQQVVHVAIVYGEDGTVTGYRNGVPYGRSYKTNEPVVFSAGAVQVVFGLRHAPAGGNRHLAGWIDKARLYDRALLAEEIAASAGVFSEHVSEAELLARLPDSAKSERNRVQFELEHVRRQIARVQETKVYAVVPKKPEPTRILARGNPATPTEEVTAGGIAAVIRRFDSASNKNSTDFLLSPESEESERRKALAHWITDSHNPLFARVIVNRLWHYHFGVGLVDSPSDLGFNGGRPSHSELLDWLASELVANGWRLKHVHRLIVNSATYRQSSRPRIDAAKKDAGNRWLWRKSPMRLDAEVVRDAVLSVSGELNPSLGGPGYHDFTTFTFNSQFYEMLDPVGASFHRRSLYRTWVRSGRNPFLEVLDCPDPSTKTPRRAVTTTPLQALSLLNNSFMLRMSDRLAERIRREAGAKTDPQIQRAFLLLYGRLPTNNEQNTVRDFVTENGLPALARVLFNSNEFLYVP